MVGVSSYLRACAERYEGCLDYDTALFYAERYRAEEPSEDAVGVAPRISPTVHHLSRRIIFSLDCTIEWESSNRHI